MEREDYAELALQLRQWYRDDSGPALTWEQKNNILELISTLNDWLEDRQD